MVIEKLRREIDDFIYQDVNVVEGYYHNQYEVIKRIHLYTNDRFETDVDGIFRNIVNYRRDAIARFLDVDTKDINLKPLNPVSYYSTMFLEQELKYWLKKNKFAMLLNEMSTELVTFGSCVLRKTSKGAEIVDLRRLFIDPSVKDILDSRFITIKHLLTPTQLREKVKDGWDSEAVERIIKSVEEQESESALSYEDDGLNDGVTSTPLIEVYERYGELLKDECEEVDIKTDNHFARTLVIVAEPHRTKFNVDTESVESLAEILYSKEWKGDYPFRDVHYSKTAGRWLGVGVVESLFNAQERINEITNQKRASMELSAIHIFQQSKPSAVKNVLTDLMNGEILVNGGHEITPIVNEERNLAAFASDTDDWNVLADRISFANDVVTGNAIPASTPATNAVIQNTNSISVFLFKRQNFALFLQEFFNELVLPQVLKDLSEEHILRFVGDVTSLPAIDSVFINEELAMSVLMKGRPLTEDEIAAITFEAQERLGRTGNERFVKIKEKLYNDLEFEFDINIVNEQENAQIISQNTFTLLQAMASNPTLLDDPVFKTLLFDYAEQIGVSPARLELAASKRRPVNQANPNGLSEALSPQAGNTTPLSSAIPSLLEEAQKRAGEPATMA